MKVAEHYGSLTAALEISRAAAVLSRMNRIFYINTDKRQGIC